MTSIRNKLDTFCVICYFIYVGIYFADGIYDDEDDFEGTIHENTENFLPFLQIYALTFAIFTGMVRASITLLSLNDKTRFVTEMLFEISYKILSFLVVYMAILFCFAILFV